MRNATMKFYAAVLIALVILYGIATCSDDRKDHEAEPAPTAEKN